MTDIYRIEVFSVGPKFLASRCVPLLIHELDTGQDSASSKMKSPQIKLYSGKATDKFS